MTSLRDLLKTILIVVLLERGICESPYAVVFSEGFSECSGYSNKVLVADGMQLAKSSDGGAEAMYLAGSLEIMEQIDDGMIIVEVSKETEIGDEPMWTCSADLCASLKDEDAPWAGALQEMGLTSCPVKKGTYFCNNLTMNMDFMGDMLNEDLMGDYNVEMCMESSTMNKKSCHNLGVAIISR